MPLRRYLPSVAVGAVLWALLYTTVGFGLFSAVAAAVCSGWAAGSERWRWRVGIIWLAAVQSDGLGETGHPHAAARIGVQG